MGCFVTRNRRAAEDPGATITLGNYSGNQRPGGVRSPGYQAMAPDPDLGWRRLPPSVAIPSTGTAVGKTICSDPTEWTTSVVPSNRPRHAGAEGGEAATSAGGGTQGGHHQRQPQQQQYPAPHAWSVSLFNDRSGHFCSVSMITLAINIAIRAEGLAKMFGIVNDPEQCSNLHQRNTSASSLVEEFARESPEAPDSHHKIYGALHVPDTGWRLLRRRGQESNALSNKMFHPNKEAKKRVVLTGSKAEGLVSASETSVRRDDSQLIRREPSGQAVWADVPEIGMNIAEQLYRLERRKENRHFLPTDSFGWRYNEVMEMEEQFRVAVSSPEGEAFWLVPEELIMNVTQWVQQTYLTSTAF